MTTAPSFHNAINLEMRQLSSVVDLFLLINSAPPSDWHINVTATWDGVVALAKLSFEPTTPHGKLAIQAAASGLFLPILAGNNVDFSHPDIASRRLRLWRNASDQGWLQEGELEPHECVNCEIGGIPMALCAKRHEDWEDAMRQRTWLGSLNPRAFGKKISVRSFTRPFSWLTYKNQAEANRRGVFEAKLVNGESMFLRSPIRADGIDQREALKEIERSTLVLRAYKCGSIAAPSARGMALQKELTLRGRELGITAMEFKEDVQCTLGPNGQISSDKEAQNLMEQAIAFLKHLATAQAGDELRNRLSNTKREVSAVLVRNRQQRIDARKQLRFANRVVSRAPESEHELVILFTKLSVANALPFHSFEIDEYAAKEGIDALCTFCLTRSMSLEKFAPVEFEQWGETYFRHDHPMSQTRLVVCWDFAVEDPATNGVGAGKWAPNLHGIDGLWRFEATDGTVIPFFCLKSLVQGN
jgi:hypothetical protein